jgi:hypothetical protein
MTFLSKLGAAILKGIGIVSGLLPIASIAYPNGAGVVNIVSHDLAAIADIITQVEAAGQALSLKGPDKLTAAAPLVAQIIISSALLSNQKIQQPDLFNSGCKSIASGMADVLNSLHPDGVQVADKKS